jgi:hypothetical protein
MTPDWSATAEPVPYAKLDDPQSLNLYAYVDNDPVSLSDADGHCGGLCVTLIVAGVAAVAYYVHQSYEDFRKGINEAQSAEAARGLIVDTATNPNSPATSAIDLNAAAQAYNQEAPSGLASATEGGAKLNTAAEIVEGGATAATGNTGEETSQTAPGVERAIGVGTKVGTEGVSELTKQTEQSAEAQPQQRQTGSSPTPSVWNGLKALLSPPPPPPPPSLPPPPPHQPLCAGGYSTCH